MSWRFFISGCEPTTLYIPRHYCMRIGRVGRGNGRGENVNVSLLIDQPLGGICANRIFSYIPHQRNAVVGCTVRHVQSKINISTVICPPSRVIPDQLPTLNTSKVAPLKSSKSPPDMWSSGLELPASYLQCLRKLYRMTGKLQ